MAGYVNIVLAIVCSELPAREASNFCDFWKLTFCNFIAFISSMIELTFFFFYMCLLRINLPNLCPNMNHFDAVDFSECHSEKVISFFLTLSLVQHASFNTGLQRKMSTSVDIDTHLFMIVGIQCLEVNGWLATFYYLPLHHTKFCRTLFLASNLVTMHVIWSSHKIFIVVE